MKNYNNAYILKEEEKIQRFQSKISPLLTEKPTIDRVHLPSPEPQKLDLSKQSKINYPMDIQQIGVKPINTTPHLDFHNFPIFLSINFIILI